MGKGRQVDGVKAGRPAAYRMEQGGVDFIQKGEGAQGAGVAPFQHQKAEEPQQQQGGGKAQDDAGMEGDGAGPPPPQQVIPNHKAKSPQDNKKHHRQGEKPIPREGGEGGEGGSLPAHQVKAGVAEGGNRGEGRGGQTLPQPQPGYKGNRQQRRP